MINKIFNTTININSLIPISKYQMKAIYYSVKKYTQTKAV